MKIPFLSRLLEIKEEQLEIEHKKLDYLHDIKKYLVLIKHNTTPTRRSVLR